jgi:cell division transport system permease protein
MALLRALSYFVEEAATSLWRSRLVNSVSVGTIAVSLFVLGSFLTVATSLGRVVSRWTDKIQVIVYLEDGIEQRVLASLENRLRADPAVESIDPVSRELALKRFRALFRDLSSLPEDLGENPFPASLEVNLKPGHQSPAEVERLGKAFRDVPGVQEIQYDLLWIERLATGVRLVRGVGAFLGGILVLAGIFTISNVIRLTIYAREDELDIMRLVGATRSYVKGPFVVEGMIQGGLGGTVAAGLLFLALRWLSRDLASSDLLGRTAFALQTDVAVLLILGGMVVGVAGSLVSLTRLRV